MATLGTKFNAQEHDTDPKEFELLPDMVARLEVTGSDVTANQDGDGTTLALIIGVVEPEEHAGRQIRLWLDLENNDAKKQKRGQDELASLCRAISIKDVDDSDELHFQSFTARVKKGAAGVSKAGRPYKARNSISRYFYPDAGDAPDVGVLDAPSSSSPPAANDNKPAPRAAANDNAAATAGGKSRPWGKKAA